MATTPSIKFATVRLANSHAHDASHASPKNYVQNNFKKEFSFHLSPFGHSGAFFVPEPIAPKRFDQNHQIIIVIRRWSFQN